MKNPKVAFALGFMFNIFGFVYTSVTVRRILFVLCILFAVFLWWPLSWTPGSSRLALFLWRLRIGIPPSNILWFGLACGCINYIWCREINWRRQEKINNIRAILELAPLWRCHQQPNKTKIKRESYNFLRDQVKDAREVKWYTLSNDLGMTVQICDLGARISSLIIPDKNGKPTDICAGFESFDYYQRHPNTFGATVGKHSDAIGPGVADDLSNRIWTGHIEDNRLILECAIPFQENGQSGNLSLSACYQLNGTELQVEYTATTDRSVPIDISHRLFVNLNGVTNTQTVTESNKNRSEDSRHMLIIPADNYIDILAGNKTIQTATKTDRDFRTSRDIDYLSPELTGYFIFGDSFGATIPAIKTFGRKSGIGLSMYTDEPGVQVSNCRFLDGEVPGRYATVFPQNIALCMAAQRSPLPTDRPELNPIVLHPGETYRKSVRYVFNVQWPNNDATIELLLSFV